MTSKKVQPADVAAAIAGGAHDLDAIAEALGVYHSNGNLRRTIAEMAYTGAIVKTGDQFTLARGPR